MTNPLDDVNTRANALKTTVRAITGMPKTSFRDVLSTGISNVADQMVAQMQGQQVPQDQASHAGMQSQPPSAQQGSRPRVLGTIFRSLFGQQQQQGAGERQPVQGTQQDARAQPGQREVVVPPTDLQDVQSRKLRRSRHMSVKDTEED